MNTPDLEALEEAWAAADRWDCRERNGGECIFGGLACGNCDDCWSDLTIRSASS